MQTGRIQKYCLAYYELLITVNYSSQQVILLFFVKKKDFLSSDSTL